MSHGPIIRSAHGRKMANGNPVTTTDDDKTHLVSEEEDVVEAKRWHMTRRRRLSCVVDVLMSPSEVVTSPPSRPRPLLSPLSASLTACFS